MNDDEKKDFRDENAENVDDGIVEDVPSNDGVDEVVDNVSDSSSYNPQNRYKKNQEYHSRQYYKDRVDETNKKRQESLDNKKETAEKRQQAKDNYRQAKEEARNDRDNSGAREQKKQAKSDYKEAKHEDKVAKREYQNAKINNRRAKFDRISDGANRVLHPIETGKGYLKNKINQHNPVNILKNRAQNRINSAKNKAKESVKKTAKKVGKTAKNATKQAGKAAGKTAVKLIAKIIAMVPIPVWIGLAVTLLIVGAALFVMVIFIGAQDDDPTNGLAATTCVYANMGGISEKTNVVVTSCNSGETVATVSLEKYIAGVALNKLGNNYNSEVMKAELIAIRSSILAEAISENSISYNQYTNTITKDQCDPNNFYWDYTRNLYKSDGDVPEYSYNENKGYPIYKEALLHDDVIRFESTAKQVSCMYLTDSNGNVINVNVNDSTVEIFNQQANNNSGSDNGSYTALLLQNFENANGVSSGHTNNASYFSANVGEYSQWKQLCSLGAPWCKVCMNKKCDVTIDSSGCALTALAMLISHSGVDTSKIPNFNPGTFTDAMRNNNYLSSGGGIKSWAYVTNLVPNFVFYKRIDGVNGNIDKVRTYADQGFYIVLEVKSHNSKRKHFLAVDNAASSAAGWSDIYVWNPSSNITHLSENKNYRANSMLIYEVKR